MSTDKTSNNAFFRQLLFITVLVALGLTIYYQLSFFTSSALGAIALYSIFRPLWLKLVDQHKWKPWLAALLLVAMAVCILLAIAYAVFGIVASELPTIDASALIDKMKNVVAKVNDYVGYQVISDNTLAQAQQVLLRLASSLLNTTYSAIANIFMMMVFLYFMFTNGRAMEQTLLAYSPFKGASLSVLKKEVNDMISSNVIGIPVVMFFQGVTAAIGYWMSGLGDIAFWAFLTALFGLVPVVGSTVIWLPLGIYLISMGQQWQGWLLIAFGIIIIANIDNVCRAVLMKKTANTHPLVAILGVMLGIPLFGFWGIIFGPLLISSFLILIKIYYKEYKE